MRLKGKGQIKWKQRERRNGEAWRRGERGCANGARGGEAKKREAKGGRTKESEES